MSYRLLNLADLTNPDISQEEIISTANLHQVDIVITHVGQGFVDVRGDNLAISDFLVAIGHRDFIYRSSQIGDTEDDI